MRGSLYPLFLLLAAPLAAQQPTPGGMQHTPGMKHTPGMQHEVAGPGPAQAGQAAFAAITQVVRVLEADSSTDWSHVDLEALRQHLIDMDLVTLRSRVRQQAVPGGLSMEITGQEDVAGAIRRMVGMHATVLPGAGPWRYTTSEIAGGMRLVVTATEPGDAALVSRIRGLGFIGMMTEGEHHAEHHLMLARGMGMGH